MFHLRFDSPAAISQRFWYSSTNSLAGKRSGSVSGSPPAAPLPFTVRVSSRASNVSGNLLHFFWPADWPEAYQHIPAGQADDPYVSTLFSGNKPVNPGLPGME